MLDFTQIPDGPPIPDGYVNLKYGTSGFRGNAEIPFENLNHLYYKCGLLFASLPFFSKEYFDKYSYLLDFNRNLGLGIVVTASHNPYFDNGIKLFSPTGHLLETQWEPLFTSFVNCRRPIRDELKDVFTKFKYEPKNLNLTVLIGWDTRPSCDTLVNNLCLGINSVFKLLNLTDSSINLLGKITTPSISYLLSSKNLDVTDDGTYLDFLSCSFVKLKNYFEEIGLLVSPENLSNFEHLYFECSYGVSGYKITKFFDHFRTLGILPQICNSHRFGHNSYLNNKCGAAYILSTQLFPESLKRNIDLYRNKRFCTFDGDVDRLLYFMPSEQGFKVNILSGDRLLSIKVMFLWVFLMNCDRHITVGVFQTKYSSTSSVLFIKSLFEKYRLVNPNVEWYHEFFPTGLKNAQKLSKNYDISIYYETNGHGNLIFNRNKFFRDDFESSTRTPSTFSNHVNSSDSLCLVSDSSNLQSDSCSDNKDDLFPLLTFLEVFFPGGDAILNCLVLELAFKVLKINFNDCMNFYNELPWEHRKIELPEKLKQLFVCSPDDDSVLLEPKGFQEKIQKKTSEYNFCRAFLRPSGTEPLLRVYVESETFEIVHEVHMFISGLVEHFLKNQNV